MPTFRSEGELIPPTKANVQVREGLQYGTTEPVLAGFPILHWQLSHETETPSALWKVAPEQSVSSGGA